MLPTGQLPSLRHLRAISLISMPAADVSVRSGGQNVKCSWSRHRQGRVPKEEHDQHEDRRLRNTSTPEGPTLRSAELILATQQYSTLQYSLREDSGFRRVLHRLTHWCACNHLYLRVEASEYIFKQRRQNTSRK